MSELIQDRGRRKDLLKHMIKQLHTGEAPEAVRAQLMGLLGRIPYDEVVEVEQELVAEGMATDEILRLCDIHTEAMEGVLDSGPERPLPEGHPARVMREENEALGWEVDALRKLFDRVARLEAAEDPTEALHDIRVRFNALMDVEKHYLRKENLLFPFLEKHGITGPPTVMWGKHDETREFLATAIRSLEASGSAGASQARSLIDGMLKPAVDAVSAMIDKEEQILIPMCLDTLNEAEWYEVAAGSEEIGWCLVVPETTWRPEGLAAPARIQGSGDRVQLNTGSFSIAQIEAVLNSIPFDITFVDAENTVRYFSHGRERIFARTKAILGRKVQFCHPPKSVDMVQRILDDFREGRETHAQFWIEMGGRFICIEYFALHDATGEFLGTLEVSQDLTAKRALVGQQRLLNYVGGDGGRAPSPGDPGSSPEAPPAGAGKPASGRAAGIDRVRVVEVYDAREVIAGGGHPLAAVMEGLAKLQPGEGYVLVTPFPPAPLLVKAQEAGFEADTEESKPGEFRTTFRRSEAGS